MGKKSLADELLELDQPSNDFDIDNAELIDAQSDGLQSESEDELKTDHYVAASKSTLRKNGPKNIYGGQVSSRDQIFGENESDEYSGSEQSEDDDHSEEETGDHSEDENEDSDSGVSLDNYNSESEDEKEDNSDKEEDEGDQHKRSQLQSLISKERKTISNRLAQSSINDSLKGFSVSNQNKTFERLLDLRIKLQKPLNKSNLLPGDKATASEFVDKESKDLIKTIEKKCFTLLDSVLNLRNSLHEKDNIKSVQLPKKRKLEEYANTTKDLDSKLAEFRSITLNKWSNKVMSSSGSNALNAGKFKVVNQSAEQQVLNNLNDIERLKKRTRLNRSSIIPLGYKEVNGDVQDNEEEDNPDIPKTVVKADKSEIPQIFDDEDFYRLLLNDLVDKKISSSNPTNGMSFTIKQTQKAQKANKNVDTKASKGRKLRFNIQDPIAHFEVPVNPKWDDYQIDEFFASLLGQKVNMNEIDEQVDEDNDVIKEDSIRLFG